MVETLQPARWNERVQRTRIAAGIKAIPIESGVRDMLSALRKREGLAVLVDRPLAREGVLVTSLPGAGHFHPVVPVALVRNTGGTGYLARIGPPIVGEGGAAATDAQMVMQRIMSWLEGIIRDYPDQWFMFRQMWPGSELARPSLSPRLSSLES